MMRRTAVKKLERIRPSLQGFLVLVLITDVMVGYSVLCLLYGRTDGSIDRDVPGREQGLEGGDSATTIRSSTTRSLNDSTDGMSERLLNALFDEADFDLIEGDSSTTMRSSINVFFDIDVGGRLSVTDDALTAVDLVFGLEIMVETRSLACFSLPSKTNHST